MLTLEQMRKLSSGQSSPQDILDENVALTAADEAMIDQILSENAEMMVGMQVAINTLDSAGAEDAINEAFHGLVGAFRDCGVINESITINTRKPKQNHVILTKDSQLKRLRMLFALNLSRNAKDRNFKRFKIGTKIRKEAKEAIMTRWGTKATAMAKRAWMKFSQTPGFGLKTAAPAKK